MKSVATLFCALLALAANVSAQALEFRSVASDAAVLYDAPSVQAKKLYLLSRYYPVEVIVALDKWVKVRDAGGGLAWMEASKLSIKRTLLVTAARAEIRAQADASSALVFTADHDVALDLMEFEGAWIKVRHRDGLTGYIAVKDVWGD